MSPQGRAKRGAKDVQTGETSDEASGFREESRLTPLHPDQIKVLRIRFAAAALPMIAAAAIADAGPLRETALSQGLASGVFALLALVVVVLYPRRRYRAWGYREGADEILIRSGLLKRVKTVVPFGRVQHIDISQGPVERQYGLATLILHTAGTRGSSVPLPGLAQGEAERLRDAIRAQIRQDLL
jgi:membrane protein YdbS with pleckstrin-like domain